MAYSIKIPGASFTKIKGTLYKLDAYKGVAEASYSVRKVFGDYAGPLLRVRRSSDNTELDIGSVGLELNTAALLAFVGAGDGFVTTLYDQTGKTRHAVQATAIYQPKIVSAGTLVTENGKPALLFDGLNDFLRSTGWTVAQPDTIVSCSWLNDLNNNTPPNNNSVSVYDGGLSAGRQIIQSTFTNSKIRVYGGSAFVDTLADNVANTLQVFAAVFSGANSKAYRNRVNITGSGNPGTVQLSGITIGGDTNTPPSLASVFVGKFSELHVFSGDLTVGNQLDDLQQKIMNYYAIS